MAKWHLHTEISVIPKLKYSSIFSIDIIKCITFALLSNWLNPQQVLESKNIELISLKQQQIEKYNTLIVLQGELNAINEEQKYHERLRTRETIAAQNKEKELKDFAKLQAILKHQRMEMKKITKDIQTLRLKIKPQNQFLLNELAAQERMSPPILAFPDYLHDVREDSARTQSTQSYSSEGSVTSRVTKTSVDSVKSN